MRKLKKIFFLIYIFFILFFLQNQIHSVQLKFKYDKNSIIDLTTDVKSTYFMNGKYLEEYNVREKSSFKINSIINNKAEINGSTSILELKKLFAKESYHVIDSINYIFFKDAYGNSEGLENIKGFHELLKFPSHELIQGESWEFPSIYNMPLLNSSIDFKMNVDVKYKFIDYIKINNKDIAVMHVKIIFNQNKNKDILKNFGFFKLEGFSSIIIKFDLTNGMILSAEETFNYFYLLFDNTIIEVLGTSVSSYNKKF